MTRRSAGWLGSGVEGLVLGYRKLGRWQGMPLAVLLLIALIAVRVEDPGPIETLRLRLFDQLQDIKPRVWKPEQVVIVDIDEESLRRFGQWPWPRSLIAQLVDTLNMSGASVIGFDLLFPEPDRLSPSQVLRGVPDLHPDLRRHLAALPTNDEVLAASLRDATVVLGMASLKKGKGGVSLPAISRTPYQIADEKLIESLHQYDQVIHTLESIATSATGHGVITAPSERDGVVRRVPLAVAIGDEVFPSLAVEILRLGIGARWFTVEGDANGVTGVGFGPLMIPTGRDGRVWLHFTRHEPGRFVSAADILDGRVPDSRVRGHVVLVGTTGIGITDFPATPVEPNMPGVEIHAQLLETMFAAARGEALLSRPNYVLWIELGLLILAGILIIGLVPAFRPAISPALYAGILLAFLSLSWLSYVEFHVLIDSSFPIIGAGLLYTLMLTTTRAAVERARRLLQNQLDLERQAAARVEGELSAARTIQMGILPRDFPAFPEHGEFSIFAMIEPAKAVGGDLYDFAMVDDDHLYFMIGDVSGKGVPASLFMAISKALYKSNALRLHTDIAHIMTGANEEISRENPAMMFVTAVAGLLNIRTGALQLCNAGHDAPIMLRPGEAPKLLEGEGGPPLCVLEDYQYPSDRYDLAPGDAVIIVTDGVTEAMNQEQALYGMDRTIAALGRCPDNADSEAVVNYLNADVQVFVAGAEPSDDTTILAIRYNGSAAAAAE